MFGRNKRTGYINREQKISDGVYTYIYWLAGLT